jgi:hypothetical protein
MTQSITPDESRQISPYPQAAARLAGPLGTPHRPPVADQSSDEGHTVGGLDA